MVATELSGLPSLDLARLLQAIDATDALVVRGRVTEVTGLIIKATVPGDQAYPPADKSGCPLVK